MEDFEDRIEDLIEAQDLVSYACRNPGNDLRARLARRDAAREEILAIIAERNATIADLREKLTATQAKAEHYRRGVDLALSAHEFLNALWAGEELPGEELVSERMPIVLDIDDTACTVCGADVAYEAKRCPACDVPISWCPF